MAQPDLNDNILHILDIISKYDRCMYVYIILSILYIVSYWELCDLYLTCYCDNNISHYSRDIRRFGSTYSFKCSKVQLKMTTELKKFANVTNQPPVFWKKLLLFLQCHGDLVYSLKF